MLAQAFEVLGKGLPLNDLDGFLERPVAVQSTTRANNPRRTQNVQASFGKERFERIGCLLLGSVAIHINEQRLDETGVLGLAFLRIIERSQRKKDITLLFNPSSYLGVEVIQVLNEQVFFLLS